MLKYSNIEHRNGRRHGSRLILTMRASSLVCGSLTYAILGPVVLLGELVAVAEEKLPAPDVENSTDSEITLMIVLGLNRSSLKKMDNDTIQLRD
jgi:hypothetical protein